MHRVACRCSSSSTREPARLPPSGQHRLPRNERRGATGAGASAHRMRAARRLRTRARRARDRAATRWSSTPASRCPTGAGTRAIIAMGGPMGAYDDELAAVARRGEARRSRRPSRSGMPFWGVCLGAQLLAASLGARVFPGPAPGGGGAGRVADRRRPRRTRCSARAPASFRALQWHGDTYELPAGASRLAGSRALSSSRRSCSSAPTRCSSISRWTRRCWPSGALCPPTRRALQAVGGRGRARRSAGAALAPRRTIRYALARVLFSRWLELVAGFPRAGS